MSRSYTIDTENWFVEFHLNDDLTTATVQDNRTGVIGRAHALRFHQDRYDENIGLNVAFNRALQRLGRKNERYFIRKTQPVNS